MGSVKTRIWPGGLSEIRGEAAQAAHPVTPRESDEPDTAVTKPVPAPRLLAATEGPADALDRQATRMHGWWEVKTAPACETRERMASTRIMPIEQLLGRGLSLAPVLDGEAPAADVAAAPAPRSAVRFRVALAIGLCAVSAVLCWVPPGSLAAARTPSGSLSTPSLPVSPRPTGATPSQHVATAPTRAQPREQHARDESTVAAQRKGRERAAVDALIAGDYGRARDLYLELARTESGPSAFSEAARILSERLHSAPGRK